ncbi:DUF6255 family natural product biosynthesis protein [Streptomyces griseocarneus]|uniref:DUF6255 family natural product biosynthesis protein n=1 Tax=Streptomyces griseocarneus TaxID=51201 RepID=UPI00167C8C1A|nr:DUF6255 family natural product biosynthesis protein [Streptomyces griseocarneus]MBZ6473448.1 hypothetical protein [Streptomyces griseocarneus]GHG56819.1 hypothetical protein GCM10018779_21420 [Streptomyces griseocarneus]
MRAVGRLVNHCAHRRGWVVTAEGEQRCDDCGTRRFTGYGALRPPGLPERTVPSPRDRARADRDAARLISRTAYRPWRRGAVA